MSAPRNIDSVNYSYELIKKILIFDFKTALLLRDLVALGRKFQYSEIAVLGLRCISRFRGVANCKLSDEFLVILIAGGILLLQLFSYLS